MAHDVFISYAVEDKPTADAVCATLEAHAIRCWSAPRDVLPGVEYAQAIVEAISQSRVMVLVFSSHSNHSPHVRREVERAMARGILILPFRIEDVPLSPSLEYCIGDIHWLDALTPPLEGHLEHLAATVKLLLSRSRTAPHTGGDPEVPATTHVIEEPVDRKACVEAPRQEPVARPSARATGVRPSARARAWLLDMLIATPTCGLLGLALGLAVAGAAVPATGGWETDANDSVLGAAWLVSWFLCGFLYIWLGNALGQTVAKRLLRLATVRSAQAPNWGLSPREAKLGRPGWRLGLLRTVVSLVGLSTLGLGYFWVLWEEEHRTWHDLVTDTMVVRVQ